MRNIQYVLLAVALAWALTTRADATEPLNATMTCDLSGLATDGAVICRAAGRGGASPYSYAWEMGDGTRATGDVVSHVYPDSGIYLIKLTITDAAGSNERVVGSLSLNFDGATFLPQLGAFCSPSSVLVGTPTLCTATAHSGTPPYSVAAWNFGDGSPILHAGSVLYTYTSPGPGSGKCGLTSQAYQIVVTVTDSTNTLAAATPCVEVLPLPVVIDIKPDDTVNAMRSKSAGMLPVAVLTTEGFDAATVDPSSVRFGKTGTETGARRWTHEDVNLDGAIDMLFFFDPQRTGLQPADTEAVMTGKTLEGLAFRGADSVRMR